MQQAVQNVIAFFFQSDLIHYFVLNTVEPCFYIPVIYISPSFTAFFQAPVAEPEVTYLTYACVTKYEQNVGGTCKYRANTRQDLHL
jgi:hypothetical protein